MPQGDVRRKETGLDTLFSLGVGLILLALISRSIGFWIAPDIQFAALRYSLLPGVALATISFFIARLRGFRPRIETVGFGWVLVVLFFSQWLNEPFNFFQGPSIHGEIILFGLISWYLLIQRRFSIALGFAALTPIFLILLFLLESNGRLLFSDDHTVFLFRFMLLKNNFPDIPFYYPLWNAGLDARDFFATGALNIFFLSYPLIALFEVESVYNVIVLGILFVLLPGSTVAATRLLGYSWRVASYAAVIVLCAGLPWYRWALNFGPLGFLTAASLLPLTCALVLRLFDPKHERSMKEAACTTIILTLTILWSPASFVLLGLVPAILIGLRATITRKSVLAFLLAALVLNLPWMIILFRVSPVGKVVFSKEASHTSTSESLVAHSKHLPLDTTHATGPTKTLPEISPTVQTAAPSLLERTSTRFSRGMKKFREHCKSTNPLIIFLALPGIALLLGRLRIAYVGVTVWLLFLSIMVAPYVPRLEFERMLVVLSIILALPVALALEALQRSFSSSQSIAQHALPAVVVFGLFLTGPFGAGAVLRNRSPIPYEFATSDLANFLADINKHKNSGRILFSGFTLHELDGGHVAPLTEMTGAHLMASSQFHDQWSYRHSIPKSFYDRGDNGIREYLDLTNVGIITAHEKDWIDRFLSKPNEYQKIDAQGPFTIFRRIQFNDSYFAEGAGEITAVTDNSIKVRVNTAHALLKFRYFPFLKSSACKISGRAVAPELTLIELSECAPGTELTIESVSVMQRVFN